jgi:hypothetical protein
VKLPGDEESERVINLSDWKRISTDFATMELARASQLESGKRNQRCLRIVCYLLAISISAIGMMAVLIVASFVFKGVGHDTQILPTESESSPKADPDSSSSTK